MNKDNRSRLDRAGDRAKEAVTLRLFDPRNGDLAFKLERFDGNGAFAKPQRFNYFSVLWIQEGAGTFHADLLEEDFAGPSLLFFNPYQTFFLCPDSLVRGMVLQFHANFFCIETYHEAVGCNGVLFNDIYGHAQVHLDGGSTADLEHLVSGMEREFSATGLAHTEALVSLLKLFLIKATRLKLSQQELEVATTTTRPQVLLTLQGLLEDDFRSKHTPADYAEALHMSPKALGRLVKVHYGRTLTELIRERLLKHARWQLLHTQRSVKEIAWEMGFTDQLYFSRLFKQATGMSPTSYREFETAIRGGSNLSI